MPRSHLAVNSAPPSCDSWARLAIDEPERARQSFISVGPRQQVGQVVHNDRRCRFQLIEHRPDRRSHGVRCRPCHRAQVRALGYDRQGTKVVAILHVEAQGVGERRQHLR